LLYDTPHLLIYKLASSKKEPIDLKRLNIKEFELQNLKKETNGVLNEIIDLHIKSLKKKRKRSDILDIQTMMTKKEIRLFSPLKIKINQITSKL
jgi:hypothetical protein